MGHHCKHYIVVHENLVDQDMAVKKIVLKIKYLVIFFVIKVRTCMLQILYLMASPLQPCVE